MRLCLDAAFDFPIGNLHAVRLNSKFPSVWPPHIEWAEAGDEFSFRIGRWDGAASMPQEGLMGHRWGVRPWLCLGLPLLVLIGVAVLLFSCAVAAIRWGLGPVAWWLVRTFLPTEEERAARNANGASPGE